MGYRERKRIPYGIKNGLIKEAEKVNKIKSILLDKYGNEFLTGKGQPYIFQRWVYMHCMFSFTEVSKVDIAKTLGFNHSTVICALREVKKLCEWDKDIRNEVIEVEAKIEEQLNEYAC